MEFTALSTDPTQHECDCLVVGVFKDSSLTATAKVIDEATGGRLAEVIDTGDFTGKSSQTMMLHKLPNLKATRVLLVGCGEEAKFNATELRKASEAAARALNESASTNAAFCLSELLKDDADLHSVRYQAEAVAAGVYRYDQTKSKKEPPTHPLTRAEFLVAPEDVAAANTAAMTGGAIGAGVALARELGNLPGNICTPTYLAEQAVSLAKETGIETEVLEEKDMHELGMGALLSVSRGSRQPAKLIVMKYNGGGKAAPIVLVGKGLTFDAGGISIKPAAAMDEMKFDMCGGASVFGTMKAVVQMKLPVNLIGVVPSSENLPDGDANKPGDVVTSMSGQTIEILNTDAEGRLILCDALTYSRKFEPAAIIDIATLTGACVIALGSPASGLLGNNDELVQELLQCGQQANDRAWQLPLWDDYQSQLDSNFADMANIGGREAGTITAACFLSRFAEDLNWAHLDIAGTAWSKGKAKGATGRPVGLLTQYCINQVAKQAG
ncbi:MAG: leucyl aminopeptidase [Acidiferrobacterales bacterium]